MTSQRLVEEFARWLYERDRGRVVAPKDWRVPDNYLNEAAIFLAGPLGRRLQHARGIEAVRELADKWERGAPPTVGQLRDALDGAS